jgi:hypothetical protein
LYGVVADISLVEEDMIGAQYFQLRQIGDDVCEASGILESDQVIRQQQ